MRKVDMAWICGKKEKGHLGEEMCKDECRQEELRVREINHGKRYYGMTQGQRVGCLVKSLV